MEQQNTGPSSSAEGTQQQQPARSRLAGTVARVFRIAAVSVAVGILLLLLVALTLYQNGYHPDPTIDLKVEVTPWASSDVALSTGVLRILSVNLNFGLGSMHIDVEGGEVTTVQPSQVHEQLDLLVKLARELNVDVLALQDVDFGSKFAGGEDQTAYLARELRFGYVVRSINWKHPYLPYPSPLSGKIMGKVDAGLAILSRYPLTDAQRFSLDSPKRANWWKSSFAPGYSVLSAHVVAGEKDHVLYVTSLSRSDVVVRERQATEVAEVIQRSSNRSGILAVSAYTGFPVLDDPEGERPDCTLDLIRGKLNFSDLFQEWEARANPRDFGTFEDPQGDLIMADYVFPEKDVVIKEWKILHPSQAFSTHRPILVAVSL